MKIESINRLKISRPFLINSRHIIYYSGKTKTETAMVYLYGFVNGLISYEELSKLLSDYSSQTILKAIKAFPAVYRITIIGL